MPLKYDEVNLCELSIVESEDKAIAITITVPCGHEQFWKDVFQLLERGPYVAFMRDSPAPLVVTTEVANYLPDGMAEALGVPRQVSSANELQSLILGV